MWPIIAKVAPAILGMMSGGGEGGGFNVDSGGKGITSSEKSNQDPMAAGHMSLGMSQAKPPPLLPMGQSPMGPTAGPQIPQAMNMQNAGGGLMNQVPSSPPMQMPPSVNNDISNPGMNKMTPPSMMGLMQTIENQPRQNSKKQTRPDFKMNEYLRGLMYG